MDDWPRFLVPSTETKILKLEVFIWEAKDDRVLRTGSKGRDFLVVPCL